MNTHGIFNFSLSAAAGAAMSLLLAAGTAQAVVIYDESVDGDAPSTAGVNITVGANVGTLLLGSNEILGTSDSGDFDDYIFAVGVGTELVSIQFTSQTVRFNGDLIDSSPAVLFAHGTIVAPVNQVLFPTVYPLSAGTYRIDQQQQGTSSTSTYQYTLTVRPAGIAEPGTLALFALGLAGLGFAGRRKAA